MTFWQVLIIVIVAIGLEGSLVYGSITYFLKKRSNVINVDQCSPTWKIKHKYVISLYRHNYPEQLMFVKYAKTEVEAIQKADSLLGKKAGYKVVVYYVPRITGKIFDILYIQENLPNEETRRRRYVTPIVTIGEQAE